MAFVRVRGLSKVRAIGHQVRPKKKATYVMLLSGNVWLHSSSSAELFGRTERSVGHYWLLHQLMHLLWLLRHTSLPIEIDDRVHGPWGWRLLWR